MFDLAMGGNYPNGICNCTTPTSATTSGASMSVAYVAVYEQGGNSTPTATATATGQVNRHQRAVPDQPELAGHRGQPHLRERLQRQRGPAVVPLHRQHRAECRAAAWTWSAADSRGTDVDWYACNGTAAQNWTHQANGELVNPHSGLCLTDPGDNTGARLDIETCTGSAQQIWTLPG